MNINIQCVDLLGKEISPAPGQKFNLRFDGGGLLMDVDPKTGKCKNEPKTFVIVDPNKEKQH